MVMSSGHVLLIRHMDIKKPSSRIGTRAYSRVATLVGAMHPLESYNGTTVTVCFTACIRDGFKTVLYWFAPPTSSLEKPRFLLFPFIAF